MPRFLKFYVVFVISAAIFSGCNSSQNGTTISVKTHAISSSTGTSKSSTASVSTASTASVSKASTASVSTASTASVSTASTASVSTVSTASVSKSSTAVTQSATIFPKVPTKFDKMLKAKLNKSLGMIEALLASFIPDPLVIHMHPLHIHEESLNLDVNLSFTGISGLSSVKASIPDVAIVTTKSSLYFPIALELSFKKNVTIDANLSLSLGGMSASGSIEIEWLNFSAIVIVVVDAKPDSDKGLKLLFEVDKVTLSPLEIGVVDHIDKGSALAKMMIKEAINFLREELVKYKHIGEEFSAAVSSMLSKVFKDMSTKLSAKLFSLLFHELNAFVKEEGLSSRMLMQPLKQ